jgi:hypothetical protein
LGRTESQQGQKGSTQIAKYEVHDSTHKKNEVSFETLKDLTFDREQMFQILCEKNKLMINRMIRQNPRLLKEAFLLVLKKNPHIIDFQNKREWFKKELQGLGGGYYGSISNYHFFFLKKS